MFEAIRTFFYRACLVFELLFRTFGHASIGLGKVIWSHSSSFIWISSTLLTCKSTIPTFGAVSDIALKASLSFINCIEIVWAVCHTCLVGPNVQSCFATSAPCLRACLTAITKSDISSQCVATFFACLSVGIYKLI